MPYEIERKGRCYEVRDLQGNIRAKCTSKAKAEAQRRLLYGIETGEWKPTGKKKIRRGRGIKLDQVPEGEVEVVDNQKIFMPEENASESECECEDAKKNKKAGGRIKNTMTGTWKEYVKTHMKGKKFSDRSEVNAYFKSLSEEFKSKKGGAIETESIEEEELIEEPRKQKKTKKRVHHRKIKRGKGVEELLLKKDLGSAKQNLGVVTPPVIDTRR